MNNNNTEDKDNLDLQNSSNQEILDYFNEHTKDASDAATPASQTSEELSKQEEDKYEVKMTKEEYDRFINLNKIENIKDPAIVPVKGVEDDPVLEQALSMMRHQRKSLLVPLDNIHVTDDEKESYLRCVLDDNAVWSTTITIANRSFKVKSKTVADQEFIVKQLQDFVAQVKEDGKATHNEVELATLMLKLNIMVSIENIGLLPINTETDNIELLKKNVEENLKKLSKISSACMNIYINVMRIFEEKEQMLGYELISGDF